MENDCFMEEGKSFDFLKELKLDLLKEDYLVKIDKKVLDDFMEMECEELESFVGKINYDI